MHHKYLRLTMINGLRAASHLLAVYVVLGSCQGMKAFGQEVNDTNTWPPGTSGQEFAADAAHLQDLGRHRDLDGTDAFGLRVVEKWKAVNANYGLNMLCQFCEVLAEYDFQSERQYQLADKYARMALRHSDQFSIFFETRLVDCLTSNDGYFKGDIRGDDWLKYRKEKTKLWLHALVRLDREIDWSYNPENPANWMQTNVPPVINGVPDGQPVDPSLIKDPVDRAKYQAVLKANSDKGQRLLTQTALRNEAGYFSPFAERYLIGLYDMPPYDDGGLKQLMDNVGLAKDRKERIMTGLQQARLRGWDGAPIPSFDLPK